MEDIKTIKYLYKHNKEVNMGEYVFSKDNINSATIYKANDVNKNRPYTIIKTIVDNYSGDTIYLLEKRKLYAIYKKEYYDKHGRYTWEWVDRNVVSNNKKEIYAALVSKVGRNKAYNKHEYRVEEIDLNDYRRYINYQFKNNTIKTRPELFY